MNVTKNTVEREKLRENMRVYVCIGESKQFLVHPWMNCVLNGVFIAMRRTGGDFCSFHCASFHMKRI